MITLKYKLVSINEIGEEDTLNLMEIQHGSADALTFYLPDVRCGYLFIGDEKYKISNHKTRVSLSLIPDGINKVKAIRGTSCISASPFLKCGEEVCHVPVDSLAVERLERLILGLYEKILELGTRVSEIEAKTKPKQLLNFN